LTTNNKAAKEIIRVDEQFYILATSSLADRRTQALKHGDTFAVFDRYGDIKPIGPGAQGVYHEETRFVSGLVLKLNGEHPMLLSSTLKEDNMLLAVNLTNSDMLADGKVVLQRGTLHLSREKFLWNATCYERIAITNYSLSPVSVSMSLEVHADFADMFEVRGIQRERRAQSLEPSVEDGELVLAYEGLDGVIRRSRIRCLPRPARLYADELQFDLDLEPKGHDALLLSVACESKPAASPPAPLSFDTAFGQAESALNAARRKVCHVHTSNEQLNDWINRAFADLHMLVTDMPEGPYPYAGVPWFSTIFGRDGIITALEMLWLEPDLARGVLCYLASTQARETNPQADAEPGKILHETRKGEMAALKETPFERYYGSVDATPLFIMLAGAYFERTGDRALLESIWPSIDLALRWIDNHGDVDGDGFVEYTRRSAAGLEQQGWKDSRDSVFHASGLLAEPPIALCEVQGYVYAAREQAAQLAEALGRNEQATALRAQAASLRENFERAFWCNEISAYALALDGRKRPCQVRTTNAGHCLFTGIASPAHARRTAEALLQDDMFTGWGIRTVSSRALRYNPMSYHNGSVWPHDNALIGSGMARYGLEDAVVRVFSGLFDAAIFMELHRLPELFCGFARRSGEGPTLYPVACSPQAWSTASVFMLLGACLRLSITASPPQIRFTRAFLPESVPELQIRNLRVGNSSVDLSIFRSRENVAVNILRREGDVEIVSFK
jgi:glycogen debranching enzyme